MLDFKATQEAYDEHEISNIELISLDNNPADRLTKIKSNGFVIKLLENFVINYPIRQLIVEKIVQMQGVDVRRILSETCIITVLTSMN